MNQDSIKLTDGRRLGFQKLGDPDGDPLFFFHGTPGSRLVFSADDHLAQIPGVQLILPERPGYGLSDPRPGRVLLDWPDDVAELADHLSLDTFAVAGESGGGPYALACAHQLSTRVSKALVLASPAPCNIKGAGRGLAFGNRLGLWLGRYAPWLMRRMILGYVPVFEKRPEKFIDALRRQMAPSDQALLEDADIRKAIVRDLKEAYRHGGEGHATDADLAMNSRGWGFDLREIAVPVYLWHGVEDTLVSMVMAQHLAGEIPGRTAHFVEGSGHLLTENPVVQGEIERVLLSG